MKSTWQDMSELLSPIAMPQQMRNIDRRAIDDLGIPGSELMERAGRGVAEYIRDVVLAGDVSERTVAIVCGRGNNGGDGFVIGRYLAEWGAKPTFYLLSTIEQVSGDAKANLERAQQPG